MHAGENKKISSADHMAVTRGNVIGVWHNGWTTLVSGSPLAKGPLTAPQECSSSVRGICGCGLTVLELSSRFHRGHSLWVKELSLCMRARIKNFVSWSLGRYARKCDWCVAQWLDNTCQRRPSSKGGYWWHFSGASPMYYLPFYFDKAWLLIY